MCRLSDRRVVHVEVVPDGAYHDVAGIQSDSDADAEALGPRNLLGKLFCRLLDSECGVASAHRMVLVGYRRAEQRHDPVAHHLVHGALVAVDRFHTMRYSHLAPDHLRAAVAVLDDVLPAPKSPEPAEVSAQESAQEAVAVGEVSPKSL
jgi:hypothetical protein